MLTMKKKLCNGLDKIVSQAIDEMKEIQGGDFDLNKINLSELERRTGISRSKLRGWKKNGFQFTVHGRTGCHKVNQCLNGFTSILDNLLKEGVSNSTVCFDRLESNGFLGSLSTVKRYIASHKYLLPAKRKQVEEHGNRGRRYYTEAGEAFQIDWGFAKVKNNTGEMSRCACFVMVCHHCGEKYIEFFTNAKQENLFIGMIHGFQYMGIPLKIITDNMKSVVLKRDWSGEPIWQKDYDVFMKLMGFETILCKPRHPFTKGKVERLVRFVKENFLQGRSFWNLTDLNRAALEWCQKQNTVYRPSSGWVPEEIHKSNCLSNLKSVKETFELRRYLCPERKISYDGFVTYENHRFGVPVWYSGQTARVERKDPFLYIYSSDLKNLLVKHAVTWSKQDQFCKDQYVKQEPEEFPTAPVTVCIKQEPAREMDQSFSKFDFSKGDPFDE